MRDTVSFRPQYSPQKLLFLRLSSISSRSLNQEENWLIKPCLSTLARLPVDKARLCNSALHVLRTLSAREATAPIIESHCAQADPALVCEALPELIHLANPAPSQFGLGDRREFVPGPLKAAYSVHETAIKNGLKALLGRKDARSVQKVARGLEVLTEQDPQLLTFLMPELAAKLARAKWLVQGDEEAVRGAVHDVRRALARAFYASPQECDAVLASYLDGATPEGADELHHVYGEVLSNLKHANEKVEITRAHRLAFRRLVAAATQTENEKVAETARAFFQGHPYELTPVAAEEIDLLLGCAAVVATKLEEFDNSKDGQLAKDFLNALDRMHRRSSLSSIMDSFVCWACEAAGRCGAASVQKVLSVLRGLPEGSDRVRAAIIGQFDSMMVTTKSLALCLPDFYSALVGPSQVVRASAARALGRNAPACAGKPAGPRF